MKDNLDSLVEHLINGGFSLEESVAILEKNLITRALARTAGNHSAASKLLGVHRNTLRRKTLDYGLDLQTSRRRPPQPTHGRRR